MTGTEQTPGEADGRFFDALLRGDADELEQILGEEFLIIDVMGGGVTSRADLLQAVAQRTLRFARVDRDPADVLVRRFGPVAVLLGRTSMTMIFDGTETTVPSRYTHVFNAEPSGWKLVAAQGTRIVEV